MTSWITSTAATVRRSMSRNAAHGNISGNMKYLRVVLLTKEELQISVDVKAKGKEVLEKVCGQLGLRETEFFGLSTMIDEEHQFINLDSKVSKFAPKRWKSDEGSGCDADGNAIFVLFFRVHFYVDFIGLLKERSTRHHYYLQLRENFLAHCQCVNEERIFQLAAYALQADLGNFHAQIHLERRTRTSRGSIPGEADAAAASAAVPGAAETATTTSTTYFDPADYFPRWVVERRGVEFLAVNAPSMHQELSGMPRHEAELLFIRESSAPLATHNLHMYRLKRKKGETGRGTIWLGIAPKGIQIYEDKDSSPDSVGATLTSGVATGVTGYKHHFTTFLWPSIKKLYFEKKKFEIRSIGDNDFARKFTYFTENDERSKYLLQMCRSTHLFQMALQPKIAEMKHLATEEKKRLTMSSGVSGDSFLDALSDTDSIFYAQPDNRVSVISNTSSNTTSGIVSDHFTRSFDNDDFDLEAFDFPVSVATGPSGTLRNVDASAGASVAGGGGVDAASPASSRSSSVHLAGDAAAAAAGSPMANEQQQPLFKPRINSQSNRSHGSASAASVTSAAAATKQRSPEPQFPIEASDILRREVGGAGPQSGTAGAAAAARGSDSSLRASLLLGMQQKAAANAAAAQAAAAALGAAASAASPSGIGTGSFGSSRQSSQRSSTGSTYAMIMASGEHQQKRHQLLNKGAAALQSTPTSGMAPLNGANDFKNLPEEDSTSAPGVASVPGGAASSSGRGVDVVDGFPTTDGAEAGFEPPPPYPGNKAATSLLQQQQQQQLQQRAYAAKQDQQRQRGSSGHQAQFSEPSHPVLPRQGSTKARPVSHYGYLEYSSPLQQLPGLQLQPLQLQSDERVDLGDPRADQTQQRQLQQKLLQQQQLLQSSWQSPVLPQFQQLPPSHPNGGSASQLQLQKQQLLLQQQYILNQLQQQQLHQQQQQQQQQQSPSGGNPPPYRKPPEYGMMNPIQLQQEMRHVVLRHPPNGERLTANRNSLPPQYGSASLSLAPSTESGCCSAFAGGAASQGPPAPLSNLPPMPLVDVDDLNLYTTGCSASSYPVPVNPAFLQVAGSRLSATTSASSVSTATQHLPPQHQQQPQQKPQYELVPIVPSITTSQASASSTTSYPNGYAPPRFSHGGVAGGSSGLPDSGMLCANGNFNAAAMMLMSSPEGVPHSLSEASANFLLQQQLQIQQQQQRSRQNASIPSFLLAPPTLTPSSSSESPSRWSEAAAESFVSPTARVQPRTRESAPPTALSLHRAASDQGALDTAAPIPDGAGEVPLSGFASALQSTDISEDEMAYSPMETAAKLAMVTQADGAPASSRRIRLSILELLGRAQGVGGASSVAVTRTCSMPKQARPHPPITRQQRRTAFEPLMGGDAKDFRQTKEDDIPEQHTAMTLAAAGKPLSCSASCLHSELLRIREKRDSLPLMAALCSDASLASRPGGKDCACACPVHHPAGVVDATRRKALATSTSNLERSTAISATTTPQPPDGADDATPTLSRRHSFNARSPGASAARQDVEAPRRQGAVYGLGSVAAKSQPALSPLDDDADSLVVAFDAALDARLFAPYTTPAAPPSPPAMMGDIRPLSWHFDSEALSRQLEAQRRRDVLRPPPPYGAAVAARPAPSGTPPPPPLPTSPPPPFPHQL